MERRLTEEVDIKMERYIELIQKISEEHLEVYIRRENKMRTEKAWFNETIGNEVKVRTIYRAQKKNK